MCNLLYLNILNRIISKKIFLDQLGATRMKDHFINSREDVEKFAQRENFF